MGVSFVLCASVIGPALDTESSHFDLALASVHEFAQRGAESDLGVDPSKAVESAARSAAPYLWCT
jgi:hypothetical protein